MIKKKFYYLLIPFLLSCSNQEIIIPEKWGENIPLVGSEDEILISHISGSSKKTRNGTNIYWVLIQDFENNRAARGRIEVDCKEDPWESSYRTTYTIKYETTNAINKVDSYKDESDWEFPDRDDYMNWEIRKECFWRTDEYE
mgnify:FL=1